MQSRSWSWLALPMLTLVACGRVGPGATLVPRSDPPERLLDVSSGGSWPCHADGSWDGSNNPAYRCVGTAPVDPAVTAQLQAQFDLPAAYVVGTMPGEKDGGIFWGLRLGVIAESTTEEDPLLAQAPIVGELHVDAAGYGFGDRIGAGVWLGYQLDLQEDARGGFVGGVKGMLAVTASWSLTGRAGLDLFGEHLPRYDAAIGYRPFHRSRRDMVIEIGLSRVASDWWTLDGEMTAVVLDVSFAMSAWVE